ncbi:MAG: TetR family transcriptional regulator, partial [Labilithrix sp.]|nr:TetR family transcriptional regulator [Labilithrix sp.]
SRAPQSAVRQKKPGLRSDRAMPSSTDSSRAADLGPSKRTARGSRDATRADARAKQHAGHAAPAAPRKKERNAAETKRRILEAAASEFAAKGFDGARLGSIARAAAVQQALIHHYFVDKAGLHAEVVRGGVEAMTEGAWGLLSQMDAPVADRRGKKRRGPAELRALAEAFVDLLLRFFATNGAFLAIMRHEARRDSSDPVATGVIADHVAPIFDAIVARLDEMRARGEVRRDIDARHLVLSCVAMIAFPFQEEPFVASIWPMDWHRPEHLAERKREVVEMILARVLP